MQSPHLIAIGFSGLVSGLFANAALPEIPWASFASSGTMVLAMAVALRYVANRQEKQEAALQIAHEREINFLKQLLTDAQAALKLERESSRKS